ncbi:MAG TPA: cysteine desulfurase NifS [Candidatus Goldiibacteriota bacterium]|nr:cysteine desulfurase NifS [Candidatus Goldiibacteriota bacterium]HPN64020.1 cysteine desulfurase NifS [Candidatus Goldiibacteriota bacterium]HRQ42806.1 cysteine desulfurase NifS [Candidatus Goldiibacteriota bacterium]
MKIHYLDNNATTRMDDEVLKAMMPYMTDNYANASGVYSFGQDARKAVEDARAVTAKFFNADDPREIIFTSGGTESDNIAIRGAALANAAKGKHIITSAIEHHAVLNVCKALEKEGYEVTYLPVDKYGVVNPDDVKKAIRPDTVLISIMAANNETGSIQPVAEIGAIAREQKIIFHTDAVQAAGKYPIDVKAMNADLVSISAHKFYGPKGVGALYIRKGVKVSAIMQGGHHENRKRPGTENVPGIVGLAKACSVAMDSFKNPKAHEKVKMLRDKLQAGIFEKIPEVILNGHPENRTENTLNVSVKFIEGEGMLIQMDFEGICASSGSACTSGSLDPSHVLLAMGLDHGTAHGSIRFSLSKYTTQEDIDAVLKALPPAVEKLRNMSPFWKNRVTA